MVALLGGCKDTLATSLSLTDDSKIGTSYDGQPPAFDGEEFFQLHPGGIRNSDLESLDEYYDLTVTLTRRTGYAPQDRMGSDTMLDPTIGLYKRADAVKTSLHMKYEPLDKAGGTCIASGQTWTGGQTYSLAATVNGFVEPLHYAGMSAPMVKGPDWFWGEGSNEPPSGIAIEIYFKDARRIQTRESMT